MQDYLLLCRSITHAQRMNSALERVGVRGWISRPPVGLTDKGCSYAVRIGKPYLDAAMQQLYALQLLPERVFLSVGDGSYREIQLR